MWIMIILHDKWDELEIDLDDNNDSMIMMKIMIHDSQEHSKSDKQKIELPKKKSRLLLSMSEFLFSPPVNVLPVFSFRYFIDRQCQKVWT